MNAPPIPRYSLAKLESLARDLLRERWPGLTIPVDIELLTEREPGVSLDFVQGLQAQFGVPGVTVYHPKEDRFTILIDEAVADGNPGFYRFTVGEESRSGPRRQGTLAHRLKQLPRPSGRRK